MGRLRYLGSKARIVNAILDEIGSPEEGAFVDLFAGTGIVGRGAADRGWPVRANDQLVASYHITTAQLVAESDVSFLKWGGYARTIEALNEAPAFQGYIHAEYSPSGRSRTGFPRRYFTVENAAKIDGLRRTLSAWKGKMWLSDLEYSLLVADLLEASNSVANIAGTYGCFLRGWSRPALKPIALVPRALRKNKSDFSVSCKDAFDVRARPEDTVYLDPPYTKRQYAAYYHLLETVAIGDAPDVFGVTGLRPWREKSSPFCFRRKALSSLARICREIGARRIFISYSSEGHVDLAELVSELKITGSVSVRSLGTIGRYRPNRTACGSEHVEEFLVAYGHRMSMHPRRDTAEAMSA